MPGTFKLDIFTVCAALGALIIAAGALLAIDVLVDGGNYSFWFALLLFTQIGTIGVLVLLCAQRLGAPPWGDNLTRAAPAIGIGIVVASVALAVKDATGDDSFWEPVNDLFFWIPITLGLLVYLSSSVRGDRALGSPSQWGRAFAAGALAVGLLISINDFSEASRNEIWVFLSGFATTTAFALLLLGASLEPVAAMVALPKGSLNPNEVLNDPRLPNVIAIGGLLIVAAGVLLGIKAMDNASSDGIFHFISETGFYIGLGLSVLIVSRGQIGSYFGGDHPYIRYLLIGTLVAMFIAGLKFAADADSDQIWVFIDEAIAVPAFAALAFALYESRQALAGAKDSE